MYEYKVGDLALMLGGLLNANRDLGTADALSQPICTDEFCRNLSVALEGTEILARNFDADPSLLQQIHSFAEELKSKKLDRRESVLHARLSAIINGIGNNLNSRRFMFMPSEEASYWNSPNIFGETFILSFPEKASFEMLEVGKCFAAARGTACVFHSMRVAEYGLRKLARKLRVTLSDRGKPHAIEYGDWSKVITAIRNKIATIRQTPVGPTKDKSLRFYSSAADHCEYLRDIWRNEVMHTRRFYSKAEALGVMHRVRDFVAPFLLTGASARASLDKRWRRMNTMNSRDTNHQSQPKPQ